MLGIAEAQASYPSKAAPSNLRGAWNHSTRIAGPADREHCTIDG